MKSPLRSEFISIALWTGLVLAIGISLVYERSPTSSLRRGDFPGFYSLAVLGWRGNLSDLYDPEQHKQLQNEAFSSMQGTFHWPLYPAYDAVLLAPLALLSPLFAKVTFILTGIVAFLWGLRILSSPTQSWRSFFCSVVSPLSLLFPPTLVGLLAGQNIGFSFLCYAVLLRSFNPHVTPTKRGHIYLGLAIGLWLFKPQYALPFFVLLIVLQKWYELIVACSAAVLLYVMAAGVFGWNWFAVWLNALHSYSTLNELVNADAMINFPRIISYALLIHQHLWTVLLGIVVCLSLLLIASNVFHMLRDPANPSVQLKLVQLAGPIIILFGPQASFYDLALCWAPLIGRSSTKQRMGIMSVFLSACLAHQARGIMPISLFWLPAVIALISLIQMAQE
jgi:Glycosyltransferase family 87